MESEFQPHEAREEIVRGFRTTRVEAVPHDARHMVCSVYPHEIPYDAWGVHVRIPALKPGEKYTYAWVHPVPDKRDLGDGQQIVTYLYSAKLTAQKLFSDPDYKRLGIFVPEGPEPTAEEIALATQARNSYWVEVVIPQGDIDFQVNGRTGDVNSNAKLAVRWLNMKRPWATELEVAAQCPACKESIRFGALRCRSCGALISWNGDTPSWDDDPRAAKAPPESPAGAPPPFPNLTDGKGKTKG